jgi:hypothetical protein
MSWQSQPGLLGDAELEASLRGEHRSTMHSNRETFQSRNIWVVGPWNRIVVQMNSGRKKSWKAQRGPA